MEFWVDVLFDGSVDGLQALLCILQRVTCLSFDLGFLDGPLRLSRKNALIDNPDTLLTFLDGPLSNHPESDVPFHRREGARGTDARVKTTPQVASSNLEPTILKQHNRINRDTLQSALEQLGLDADRCAALYRNCDNRCERFESRP